MILAAEEAIRVPGWLWIAVLVLTPALLAIDLFVVGRRHPQMTHRAAAFWAVFWFVLGLGFTGVVVLVSEQYYGIKYATGYLVEKALTIDQVFVIALVVRTWKTPQPIARWLVWYALIALIAMRLPFIALGYLLSETDSRVLYLVMAGLFVAGGITVLRHRDHHGDPTDSRWVALLSRRRPVIDEFDGREMVVRRGGRKVYTLAAVVMMALLTTDLYFGATVPLAFAFTKPPFLVLTSALLSLLGCRSLYVFANSIRISTRSLKTYLAVVLFLVAGDLLISPFLPHPTWLVPLAIWCVVGIPIIVAWHRHHTQGPVDLPGASGAVLEETPI